MSVHLPLPSPSSLDAIVQRAGGVRATDHGQDVVTSYGSPAGELAACVTAVGLADWSQVTKLELKSPTCPVGERTVAPGWELTELTRRLTGIELAPGGVVTADGAWWCADATGSTIVLCEPAAAPRLRAALGREAPRRPRVTVTDRTADWAALAIVGRRTRDLLTALGVYGPFGDPRSVPPFLAHRSARWLLQSDDLAWAVLPRADAPALWRTIDRAGRPLSLCAVGHEAVARYALTRRSPALR